MSAALQNQINDAAPKALENLHRIAAIQDAIPIDEDQEPFSKRHTLVNLEASLYAVINSARRHALLHNELPVILAITLHDTLDGIAEYVTDSDDATRQQSEAKLLIACLAEALNISQQTKLAFDAIPSAAVSRSA